MSDMTKPVDSMLRNLRYHSPKWVDRIRRYINGKLKRIDILENKLSTLRAENERLVAVLDRINTIAMYPKDFAEPLDEIFNITERVLQCKQNTRTGDK